MLDWFCILTFCSPFRNETKLVRSFSQCLLFSLKRVHGWISSAVVMVIRLLKVEIWCNLQLTDGELYWTLTWQFCFILPGGVLTNVKCSIDLPSIMQEFLEVSQFYSLLGAVILQDLSISSVKSQTKLPVFQSEIRVNPRLHCTSFPCFASPHFLLPRLLDHLRFASKCMVKSLDI